jgi:P-type Ca2+ transporter type 2C
MNTSDAPDLLAGLSDAEAVERLRTEGWNELPSSRKRNLGGIVLDVLKEPMFLLLLACGAIYFLLGDRNEAMVLLAWSSPASRSTRSTRRSVRSRRCETCRAHARSSFAADVGRASRVEQWCAEIAW